MEHSATEPRWRHRRPHGLGASLETTEGPALSLIVPTLNEAENITAFLGETRSVLDAALPGGYELIVVDDDSPDGTWRAAVALGGEFPQLRVMRRRDETGLARAVIRGWQAARGRVLGTINADFQHPPAVLAAMAARMEGADLVLATRHADGGGLGDWGVARRLTSRGAKLIGRALLPGIFARVSDPLSGCYFVRREAIAGVELKPAGYKSLVEVLARGRVEIIRECGYEMRRRLRGRSKARAAHSLKFVRQMVRLRAELGERGRP
ncbi:MAG: polyprenol monophosphomannose synthase [Acidobacteriia bacterium]|nr:polyprenol monophosphomannose synthase [Terriglobia bacterium]